jgi:hypothetical protein
MNFIEQIGTFFDGMLIEIQSYRVSGDQDIVYISKD